MTDPQVFSDANEDTVWLKTNNLQACAAWDKTNSKFHLTLERLDTHETLYIKFEKEMSFISVNQQNAKGWHSVDFELEWDDGEISQLKRQDCFLDRYYTLPLPDATYSNGFCGANTTYLDPENFIYEYKLAPNEPIEFSALQDDIKETELFEKSQLSEYVFKTFNEYITELCLNTNFQKLANINASTVSVENIAIMCDAILSNNVDFYTAQEIYSRLSA